LSDYREEINEIIKMLEEKDARGLDRIMYKYKEMGSGMIFIAMYHGLKQSFKQEQEAKGSQRKGK